MSDKSKIEWTDASAQPGLYTWNPVRGCTKISAECKHCYAETFAERFRGVAGHPFEFGFDIRLVHQKLEEPLKWRAPRMVFVNSMSDLFHQTVPDEYILKVARVMRDARWHTFQVLTKRADRLNRMLGGVLAPFSKLPNIWWGVSVENRKHGVPRTALLQDAPAAVRFLSIEPLLEDLGRPLIENGRAPRHRLGDPGPRPGVALPCGQRSRSAGRAGPARGRWSVSGWCRCGISAAPRGFRSSSSNGAASRRRSAGESWMGGSTAPSRRHKPPRTPNIASIGPPS